jgi:hypothetical protein
MVLNWIASLLILSASISLLLSRDWRWNLGALAAQYLGVFWLVHASWPIATSAVKLITGWMACAALGITMANMKTDHPAENAWQEGGLFRLFTAALAGLVAFILAVQLSNWLGIALPISWGGLLLVMTGLLLIGITTRPLRVVLGLLALLAGFEILYAAVETAALVTAAQAVITLGLALTGAYMLTAAREEEGQ